MVLRQKKLVLFGLAVLSVFGMGTMMGCGQIKEAREAVKGVSEGMKAAKDMAQSAEDMAGSLADYETGEMADWNEISEDQIRKYYTELAGLREKYPEIEFQVPMTAAVSAGAEGKDLKRIIEKESRLSYGEYNQLSLALIGVMGNITAAGMTREIVPALETAVAEMEKLDTSEMTAEQREEVEAQIAEQKEALAAAKEEASSPDVQAKAEKLEKILEIRRELGFE